MTALSVRVAGLEDGSVVERVLTASYPQLLAPVYEPDLLARALPVMTKANPKLLASGTYYVCEAGSEAVGCGGWTMERPPGGADSEPGLAHLRHFAVRPDWVGRGVGRALYRKCEESARAAGVRRFEVWSTISGEGFYRAVGFAPVEAIAAPMGAGIALPSIVLCRSI